MIAAMAIELVWDGKRAAAAEAAEQASASMELPEGNVVIEGDNLDVLRALDEPVDLIYIDPPYNTGNDFTYHDNFAGHEAWLSMMYPRLLLARRLLTDTGSMLISIDDNEIDTLTRLCKEIFGDAHVEVLVWNTEAEGSSGTLKQVRTVRSSHEYVVACHGAKVQWSRIHEALAGREHELQTANLAVNAARERSDHPNHFTITGPHGDEFTRQWKWDREEIERLRHEDLLYFGRDERRQPRRIIPTDHRRTTYLRSILNYGGTTVGRKDFEAVMGKDVEFSYPKPIVLLRKLILSAAGPDATVLDFFAGTGTTGVAVEAANAEDGGTRRFILVQQPEPAGPRAVDAGLPTLAAITRERLARMNIDFSPVYVT